MIPVKLQMQNFMAYKALETLSFSDIHVACLSGENGSGKSTILDAITWSLWGKARVSHNDDLVHLGETEMEVEYSFLLSGDTYRVLRRRTLSGRGKTELHVHVADAGGWRTLTENSIRKTQQKIDRLLRLDYDTFINSAFILQGRADEFTQKTSKDRKEILAEILGLGVYDEYGERARDEVRRYQQEIKIIEGQIVTIDEELAREPEYRIELETSQTEAAQLRKSLEQTEQTMLTLRQRYQALEHQRRQMEDLQARLDHAQTDIDELRKMVVKSETKVKDYTLIVNQKDEIQTGHKQLQDAQADLDDWTKRLARSSELSQEKHRLETAINQARTKLEANLQHAKIRLAELQPKVAAMPNLEKELAKLTQALAEAQALEQTQETQRHALDGLTQEAADLRAKNGQLRSEMEQIDSRLSQLKEAGARCPICTQPLSDEYRKQVEADFMQQGTTRGDAYRTHSARLSEIEQEQKALQRSLKKVVAGLRKLPKIQADQATRQQLLADARASQTLLAEMEEQRITWQKSLADKTYEAESMAQLSGVETALTQLGYDSAAHKVAQTQVEALNHFELQLRRLEDALTRLDEEKTRLKTDQDRLERILTQTASDRQQVEHLQAETAGMDKLSAELTTTNQELDRLQKQERLARSAVGAAEQKLNHVAQQAKERTKKEDRLSELKETMGIYQELRTAFGKNGVQALLIENTIPEIEDEANNILSRMTDGRMNLQFITQREAKSGQSLIETLDIRIADELGTRNYELYSGGEAFRVNFAIRIALSKLLARRSGARLQTLVIDEGFGSQDTQGRERLVDAINKIRHEFEKIIVITHIDEIKDVFPTRITVQKTPDGSKISVG